METIRLKFDTHGLGDCVHFAQLLQLYKRRGYDVTVQAEENKLFIWRVAGVNIVQGGGLPHVDWGYPGEFESLHEPDHLGNKIAHGICHRPLPNLIESREGLWNELCGIRLDATPHVPESSRDEARKFIEGLPRPIVCVHTRGTNWAERKSIPFDVGFQTITKLLDADFSIVSLNFDRREPIVSDPRVRSLKPEWGHISLDRLCALYELCDLMIGIDSGPFHVASMTGIKALGVFRHVHPVRCCVPSPNATYFVSDHLQHEWRRRSGWKFAMYSGQEPSADDIVAQARRIVFMQEDSPVPEALPEESVPEVIDYERVGHDRRQLELKPDGTIGFGSGKAERAWRLVKRGNSVAMQIYGEYSVICECIKQANGEWHGQWLKFEKMPVVLRPFSAISSPPVIMPCVSIWREDQPIYGRYLYRRVYSDERQIELLDNGQIGEGSADCEQRWEFSNGLLRFFGKKGETCALTQNRQGVWHGQWNFAEKMDVQLWPQRITPPPMPDKLASLSEDEFGFHWMSVAQLRHDVMRLCEKLPPLAFVSGIPRSGLIPAAMIASQLNIPYIELNDALDGMRPVSRGWRVKPCAEDLPGLIVDDTIFTGHRLNSIRSRANPAAKLLWSAVYVDKASQSMVDFHEGFQTRKHRQTMEWNLFQDEFRCSETICDMDGVLCEDWYGNEVDEPERYFAHTSGAKKLAQIHHPLRAVVTGRIERFREQTEQWLRSNNVSCAELVMYPGSVSERDRSDIGEWKAKQYMRLTGCVFVESCKHQAVRIFEVSGMPVLDFTNMVAHYHA